MSYTIAIAHSKGGTGKTTTAVQLSDAIGIRRIADIDVHQGLSVINTLRSDNSKWEIIETSSKAKLADSIAKNDKAGPLLIDCGGFDSDMTRVAIALADLVITPANDDITEQLGLAVFNRTLANISNIAGEKITAHVLMTRTHPSRKNFDAITKAIEELEHLTMMNSYLSNRTIYPTIMAERGAGITSYWIFWQREKAACSFMEKVFPSIFISIIVLSLGHREYRLIVSAIIQVTSVLFLYRYWHN